MAFFDTTWYLNAGDQSTTGYYAVAKWAANTAYTAGQMVRQNAAPTVNNERVFICIVAGTSHLTTEPTWSITRGAKTTDNTVTWQECTGAAAVNGDATNTNTWTGATGNAAIAISLGYILKRNNGASYWICSTAGTTGTGEPAWPNDTAGSTRTSGTTTWTCLGVVGNFTGGQAPHARLTPATASTWFAAGNTLYVGDNHAETSTSSITAQPAITATTTGKIVCHNHSGSYPPATGDLMTTATISTTAASTNINIIPSGQGTLYIYGIILSVGVGQSASASMQVGGSSQTTIWEACSFRLATTSGSATIALASGSVATIVFNNCTMKFAAVGQRVSCAVGNFFWRNTGDILVSGSSVPTALFFFNTVLSNMVLEALDLSSLTGSILNNSSIFVPGTLLIKDCKLNASMTFGTFGLSNQVVQVISSDSSGTTYKSARYQYEGSEVTETSITRVNGATDPAGQLQSRKITVGAATVVDWLHPFKAEPMAIYNSVTGSDVTVTVCGTINAGALPNNDEIWMEVEYFGTASYPLGIITNTTKANFLATAAAVDADSSSWNGGGSGAGWTTFKLVKTLTVQPQLAGLIWVRVYAAKATAVYYIDPKITLT